jgi:hypothetical protein
VAGPASRCASVLAFNEPPPGLDRAMMQTVAA